MSRHPDPQTRCTPVADWPAIDKAAWALAQEPADPFDPSSGRALRWRASTRKVIENGYGRWLGDLERAGELDPAETPGERVSHARVAAYRDRLRAAGNADYTVAGRLQQLCNALRIIEPEGDWDWIHRASSRLYARAVPARDLVRRMQPAEDVIALGHDLMHGADHDRFRTPCERAKMFRDGLMLAFLVHRPFRVANLAGITLGRELQLSGGRWRLFIEADETKNEQAIECAWPDSLVDALGRYLEVHREELLKAANEPHRPTPALWVSQRGTAMGSDAIAFQIGDRTKETFGEAINPHTFRHIANTTLATANPEGVTDIKAVLGHSSMAASEKHYNRARMIGAGEALHATIAKLRKGK